MHKLLPRSSDLRHHGAPHHRVSPIPAPQLEPSDARERKDGGPCADFEFDLVDTLVRIDDPDEVLFAHHHLNVFRSLQTWA